MSPGDGGRLTIFPDVKAFRKTEQPLDIARLLATIRITTAPAKTKLPLIKLATFGNNKTEKGSLRHDANMLNISGLEADYDAERISFDDACAKIMDAGLSALLYTSPSHTEDAPRWRVICPFSQEYPASRRDEFMGRLSGLFNGNFSLESWTLSQSYYIGSVKNNPSHRAETIDGTPIDLLDDLDETWIGRPAPIDGTAAEQGKVRPIRKGAYIPTASNRLEGFRKKILDNLRRDAVEGQKHPRLRASARSLGGIQAEARFSDADAVQWLMDALPNSVKDWVQAESTAKWGLAKGREEPIELEDRPNPKAKANGKANGAAHPNGLEAKASVSDDTPDTIDDTFPPETHQTPHPILDAAEFMATFTNPDYLIDGIVQRGRVHALTSMTGHGKTALALLLGCSIAMHWDIGNIEVAQGEVIFLAGENPDDLCGRFFAACQHYEINPNDLPIRVIPGNFPMDADAADALKKRINETRRPPALIIADSAAAYFQGDDENQNVQMGAFARNFRVLTECEGKPAVLILCHPVKNPGKDNLIPRGGGAFLNEIDVNLTLWADAQDTTTLHWHGKIRGADFQPVNFALKQVKIMEKTDAKGRPFVSIVAALQTEEQADKTIGQATTDENTVLEWLRRQPGISMANIAGNVGWQTEKGGANKVKVQRLIISLVRDKLVRNWRGKYRITDLGKKELSGENC
jgi:hypothetical protein